MAGSRQHEELGGGDRGAEMSERVKFQGTEYWLLCEPDGDFGPIAPLEHCDESGNLLMDAAFYVSFAHLWEDGRISRYGTIIGTREDLEQVARRTEAKGEV